jgi:hypothetical protein
MPRSALFDRLNQELEAFGKKAQSALDEGKLQIELLRMRRRQDSAARDLGLLVHRRERGAEAEPRRVTSCGWSARSPRRGGSARRIRRHLPWRPRTRLRRPSRLRS